MKKRILCLVQLAPPVHGASMMNGYLTNSQAINDHFELEIINLQFNKSVDELKKFSIRKIFRAFRYGLKIIQKLYHFKPELVYLTLSSKGFAFYRDALYIFLIKRFDTKIIFHLHSKGINKNAGNNSFKTFIYRQVFKNTDSICLSQTLTRDIDHVSKSKPYVIPCGIPVVNKTGPKKLVHEQRSPQILYLSNFIETKGILIFIDALSLLKQNGEVFKAKLVGAPADVTVEMLEQKIMANNLSDCIDVIGPLYNETKMAEYERADIFVFPTFYENEAFPLVLLEALQFGLPVISTFEGGIPEMIINNETGLLVESKNPKLLANSISKLMNDPVLRNEMGKKGYIRFMNNYTLEHFENNVLHAFCDVLNKKAV